MTAEQGAIAGALANLGMAAGRPLIGPFSDGSGRSNMVSGATFLARIYCLYIWTMAQIYSVLLVFSFFSGIIIGTYFAISRYSSF